MNSQKLNITQPISEYIYNLYKRRYTTFIYRDGEGFYLSKGELIPAKEFESYFPLCEKIGPYHHTREDIDTTHIH